MNSRDLAQTYYEILQISSGAAHHEIVAAYNRAKEAYAPDSPALYTMFTQEEATELRGLVEEAFLILGNQTKRKEYDQRLTSQKPSLNENDLPDFDPAPPTPVIAQRSKVQQQQNIERAPAAPAPNSVPSGFAKSRLSIYEIRPELEEEIKNQQLYDGAFLRKVRLYKNINLDQLSKESRISRGYLAALEADDFQALPAPVFLRGFVIQVARMLGLNETLVANTYMSRVKKEL